jgi:DNA-binding response OmpR family regulator
MPDKKVILVVDDESFIVEMITMYLQISGYEVRGAYTGQDGLTLVQLEKPDALLLDLMLPDIEGFEVCERVRAMPDVAHMPILIISARVDPESKARAEKAGANGYLTKPVKMAELGAELERVLNPSPAPSADQPDTSGPPPAVQSPPDTSGPPAVQSPLAVPDPSAGTPPPQADQTNGDVSKPAP